MRRVAAMCLILAAGTAQAEVVLRTKEGSFQIRGEILNFDGTAYDIQTDLGRFSVPASSVECSGDGCPTVEVASGGDVRGMGSDILVSTLMPEAVKAYTRVASSGMRVIRGEGGQRSFEISDITGTVTGTLSFASATPAPAFEALLARQVDAVFSSRRVSNPEVEAFLDAGLGDPSSAEQEHIIAQDGLVAVVAPQNPVRSLTIEEMEGVFSGRITNWSELGGPNQPIRVVAPAEGSGEAEFFFQTVLDPQFSDFASGVERVGSVAEIPQAVAADPLAIGLSSTAHTEGVAPVALAGECGLVTEATPFNIKAEDYPLSRRLYLYTAGDASPSGMLADLIGLFDTADGQMAVERTGLISLVADTTSLDGQGRRLGYALADREQAGEAQNLRDFAEEVAQAYRLSTTFRFSSGSSQLDNKARADVARLVEFLARPENADREVLLVGFTDSIGQSNVNLVLSERRAQQVLDEIVLAAGGEIDPTRVQVLGFGASAPIACNASDGGRQLNRRVEVWLR